MTNTLQSTPFILTIDSSLKPAFWKAFNDALFVCLTSPLMSVLIFLIVRSISVAIPFPRWFESTLKLIKPSTTRSWPTGISPSKKININAESIILLNHLTWFSHKIGSVLWDCWRTSGSLAQSKYSFMSEASAKRNVINANI